MERSRTEHAEELAQAAADAEAAVEAAEAAEAAMEAAEAAEAAAEAAMAALEKAEQPVERDARYRLASTPSYFNKSFSGK